MPTLATRTPCSILIMKSACLVVFTLSLFAFWTFFSFLPYGFDITDEGFYLMSISNPWAYSNVTTYFAFVLHPLWDVSGHNVYKFRLSFWVAMCALSWLFFYLLLSSKRHTVGDKRAPFWRVQNILLSFALSFSVVNGLLVWLPTPNYNSLALLSVLIFAIGLAWEDTQYSSSWVVQSFLFGLSGAVAFVAKPTVAASLAVLMLIHVFAQRVINKREKPLKKLILSGGVSLIMLFGFAHWSSGSILGFVDSLSTGVRDARILLGSNWGGVEYLLWRGGIRWGRFDPGLQVLLFVVVVAIASLAFKSRTAQHYDFPSFVLEIGSVFLFGAFAVYTVLVVLGLLPNVFKGLSGLNLLLLLCLPSASVVLGIYLNGFCGGRPVAANIIKALFLIALPYCYVLGTSNSYTALLPIASMFIISIACCFYSNQSDFKWMAPLAVYVVCSTLLLSPISTSQAYRQPGFSHDSDSARFEKVQTGALSGIYVHKRFGLYVEEINALASKGGMQPSQPVIDLTGASPGSLFAINATSLGSAWMLGGYEGSRSFALTKLEQVSRSEFKRAWVLVENWSRQIDSTILNEYGLNLESDYHPVGSVIVPKGWGGRKEDQVQTLYKPRSF